MKEKIEMKYKSIIVSCGTNDITPVLNGLVFVSVFQTSILPRHFRFVAAKLNCRGNCPGKTWAEKSGTFAAARITSWAMFNRVSILVVAGPFAAAKVLLPRQIAICRGN